MPMRLGTPIPNNIEWATETINGSKSWTLQENRATLVHFWAASCHICHETMDEVVRISKQYQADGLQTVAIHMPRFESDTDIQKVLTDITEYAISQPVLIDNDHRIAKQFENEYVPAFFIFGKDGTLKFRAAGDKGFQKVEPKIREALGLQNTNV